jgi:hypothetical protein
LRRGRAGDSNEHRGHPPTRTDPHGHSPQGLSLDTCRPTLKRQAEGPISDRWARLGW